MKLGENIFWKGMKAFEEGQQEEAHKHFLEAALLGYARAYNAVGKDFYLGEGTEVDYKKAWYYFKKAYELGWEKAVINLGEMYYNCEEFDLWIDKKQGIEYLKAAVKLGDAYCMGLLALCYYQGRDVEVNVKLAVYYAQKAVEGEDPAGYLTLAMCYGAGVYVEKNPAYARYCFEQFAEAAEEDLEWCLEDEQTEGFGDIKEEILAASSEKPPMIIFDDTEEGFFEEES